MGRPRLDIDLEAVADAVAELFAEGGIDKVSIESTAERISVSRGTLYRTVPTKEHLLGILFERSMKQLLSAAEEAYAETSDPRERLLKLIEIHVSAAIDMRSYMAVFFGGGNLPHDVYERWHESSRAYESVWQRAVTEAMKKKVLKKANPVLTTRLLLGMCIWISRWYRPEEGHSRKDIALAAGALLDSP
jgi:AcrR family transcriptional regulator